MFAANLCTNLFQSQRFN